MKVAPDHVPSPQEILTARILSHQAKVTVLGQGYVGFALAELISENGFVTYGYDTDPRVVRRRRMQNTCRSYHATYDTDRLRSSDVVVIAVPTPTTTRNAHQEPDLSHVIEASTLARLCCHNTGHCTLVIVESTYAPGTTRTLVGHILNTPSEIPGLLLAYSPERIDPGNDHFSLANTPKLVSGLTNEALEVARQFYGELCSSVIPAHSVEIAEAAKVLENTFRFINIAWAQEFDDYCVSTGLDSFEVTKLASTKPFGYLPFYAGVGIGGHCIPEDPYFLYQSFQQNSTDSPLLGAAILNHESRLSRVIARITDHINKELPHARILCLGLAYKPDSADISGSAAVAVFNELNNHGYDVAYVDPFVPEYQHHSSLVIEDLNPSDWDLAVILTAHSCFKDVHLRMEGWNVFEVSKAVHNT